MRNDATEAALGLLGLTSGLDAVSTVPLKRKQSVSSVHPLEEEDDSANSESISCICGFSYDDGFSIGCDSCFRWCHAACFGIVEAKVPEEWQCWVCSPRPVDREGAVRIQKARQKAAQELEREKHKRRVSPGVDRKGRRMSAAAIDGGGQNKRKRRPSINVAQQPAEDELVDIDEPWTHSYVHIDKDIIPNDGTRDKLQRVAAQWRGITAIESDSSTSASPSTTPVILTPDALPSTSQIHLRPLDKASYHPSLMTSVDPSVRPPSYAVHAARHIASSAFITPFVSTIIPTTAYLSDPLNAYAHLSMPKPFVHLMGPPLDVALDARAAGNQSRFVRSGCRPNAVLRPLICARHDASSAQAQQRLTSDSEDTLTFGVFALRDLKAHEEVVLGWEWDDGSVIHHLPALIDSPHTFPPPQLQQLRQQFLSMLHALSSTFTTCACGSKARDCALTRMAEFVDSSTPPSPSPLSPSPTSFVSAPSREKFETHSRQEDDEGKLSGRISRRATDFGPLIGIQRGFRTRERVPSSGGMTGVEMVGPARELFPITPVSRRVSEGSEPSVSFAETGYRHHQGRSEHPKSGSARASSVPSSAPLPLGQGSLGYIKAQKGKSKATRVDPPLASQAYKLVDRRAHADDSAAFEGLNDSHKSPDDPSSSREVAMDIDGGPEDKLPPKLRKAWIRKSYETLRSNYLRDEETSSATEPVIGVSHNGHQVDQAGNVMDVDEQVFDPKVMPPPPMPPPRSPLLTISPSASSRIASMNDEQISPSIPFANLSLLSPAASGPAPYFSGVHRSPSPSCLPRSLPLDSVPLHVENDHANHPEHASSNSRVYIPQSGSLSSSGTHVETSTYPLQSASVLQPKVSSQSDSPADHTDMTLPHDSDHSPRPFSDVVPGDSAEDTLAQRHGEGNLIESSLTDKGGDYQHFPSNARLPSPPPPPPPPPSKVKLSLKDFALRKKKQREELVKAQTSPSIPLAVLDQAAQSTQLGPATEETAVTTSSATITPAQGDAVVHESTPEPSATSALPDRPPTPTQRYRGIDAHLSASESLQAKVEMVEEPLPHEADLPGDRAGSETPLPPEPPPPPSHRTTSVDSKSPAPRTKRLLSPGAVSAQELRRQISQEDGEILSPPPHKAPAYLPRSRSPPTHPRSFHSGSASAARVLHPPTRRPLQPALPRAHQNNFPSRPLPSAPRALRLSYPSYPPSPAVRGLTGLTAPRGPSADRDRADWDRDRIGRGRGRGSGGSRIR